MADRNANTSHLSGLQFVGFLRIPGSNDLNGQVAGFVRVGKLQFLGIIIVFVVIEHNPLLLVGSHRILAVIEPRGVHFDGGLFFHFGIDDPKADLVREDLSSTNVDPVIVPFIGHKIQFRSIAYGKKGALGLAVPLEPPF